MLGKLVFFLYFGALIGLAMKAISHTKITNVWQMAGLLMLPIAYLVLPALIFFIIFAIKGFKIGRCKIVAERLSYAYIAFAIFQIISSKPL